MKRSVSVMCKMWGFGNDPNKRKREQQKQKCRTNGRIRVITRGGAKWMSMRNESYIRKWNVFSGESEWKTKKKKSSIPNMNLKCYQKIIPEKYFILSKQRFNWLDRILKTTLLFLLRKCSEYDTYLPWEFFFTYLPSRLLPPIPHSRPPLPPLTNSPLPRMWY